MLNQVLSAAYGVGQDKRLSFLTYTHAFILILAVILLLFAAGDLQANIPSEYAVAILIMIVFLLLLFTGVINMILKKR